MKDVNNFVLVVTDTLQPLMKEMTMMTKTTTDRINLDLAAQLIKGMLVATVR